MKSGRECRKEVYRRAPKLFPFPASCSFRIGLAATRPAEKTKDPTPTSITDVPQFSTFAKRRGKILKSTASMAIHVMTIMLPLYMVRNGFIGRSSGLCADFAAKLETGGLAFLAPDLRGGRAYTSIAGASNKVLRSIGFEE